MLDASRVPRVDDSFFSALERDLDKLKERHGDEMPAQANEDPAAFVLTQLSDEVRPHVESVMDLIRGVADEGYIEFRGSDVRVGSKNPPLPKDGLAIQFPRKYNSALCRLGWLLLVFGLAVAILALAIFVLATMSASITLGATLNAAIIALLMAVVAIVAAGAGKKLRDVFCANNDWPVELWWQPGKSPDIRAVQGGWAE